MAPAFFGLKGHYFVAVQASVDHKHSSFLVLGAEGYLMVPRKRIHKALQGIACYGIHQFIDLRQRIAVIWACSIQIGEVHAHRPSPVRFLDKHHIRDPLRILALSNEVYLQQVRHLCGRYRSPLEVHVSLLLDHWLVCGIYVQLVLGSIPGISAGPETKTSWYSCRS